MYDEKRGSTPGFPQPGLPSMTPKQSDKLLPSSRTLMRETETYIVSLNISPSSNAQSLSIALQAASGSRSNEGAGLV